MVPIIGTTFRFKKVSVGFHVKSDNNYDPGAFPINAPVLSLLLLTVDYSAALVDIHHQQPLISSSFSHLSTNISHSSTNINQSFTINQRLFDHSSTFEPPIPIVDIISLGR